MTFEGIYSRICRSEHHCSSTVSHYYPVLSEIEASWVLVTALINVFTVLLTLHHVVKYIWISILAFYPAVFALLFGELCCVEVLCWCRGCVWTWLFLVCSWAGPASLQTLLLWKTLLILQIVSSAAWLMPSNLWPAQIALSLSTPTHRPPLVFTFPASSYCSVLNFPCFCLCSFLQ